MKLVHATQINPYIPIINAIEAKDGLMWWVLDRNDPDSDPDDAESSL